MAIGVVDFQFEGLDRLGLGGVRGPQVHVVENERVVDPGLVLPDVDWTFSVIVVGIVCPCVSGGNGLAHIGEVSVVQLVNGLEVYSAVALIQICDVLLAEVGQVLASALIVRNRVDSWVHVKGGVVLIWRVVRVVYRVDVVRVVRREVFVHPVEVREVFICRHVSWEIRRVLGFVV